MPSSGLRLAHADRKYHRYTVKQVQKKKLQTGYSVFKNLCRYKKKKKKNIDSHRTIAQKYSFKERVKKCKQKFM